MQAMPFVSVNYYSKYIESLDHSICSSWRTDQPLTWSGGCLCGVQRLVLKCGRWKCWSGERLALSLIFHTFLPSLLPPPSSDVYSAPSGLRSCSSWCLFSRTSSSIPYLNFCFHTNTLHLYCCVLLIILSISAQLPTSFSNPTLLIYPTNFAELLTNANTCTFS